MSNYALSPRALWKMAMIVALFLTLWPFSVSRAEAPPAEVLEAATNGLQTVLKTIPKQHLSEYGFASTSDFSRAQLKTPWNVKTITPTTLLEATPEASPETLVSPTLLWFFPIEVDGIVRCILKVDYINGSWTTFGIGMPTLAKMLEQATTDYPASQCYTLSLVIIYQAGPVYSVLVSKDLTNQLVPLGIARTWFGLDNTGKEGILLKTTQQNIISQLKQMVTKNLNQSKDAF